jgi:Secretion system C-terminal sorting domain
MLLKKSTALFALLLNVFCLLAQDVIYVERTEISPEMNAQLLTKYTEGFSVISLNRQVLDNYLRSKTEGATLTLAENTENGKSITFSFAPKDIRTDNYVLYLPNIVEGGYQIVPKSDIASNTFFGSGIGVDNFNISIYSSENTTRLNWRNTNKTFVIEHPNVEPLAGDPDIFIWGTPRTGEKPPYSPPNPPPPTEKCDQSIVVSNPTATQKVCPMNAPTQGGAAVVNFGENSKRFVETNISLYCTDCDPSLPTFQQKIKAKADNALSLVDEINGIYSPQTGLNVVPASPWINYPGQPTNQQSLPNCLKGDYWFAEAFLGGIIGGHTSASMCKNVPAFASGNPDRITASHELAHTMGVPHDCCCDGLMATAACDKFLVITDQFTERSKHILNQNIPSYPCLLNNPLATTNSYDWISGPKVMCKGAFADFSINIPAGYKLASATVQGVFSYFVSTTSGLAVTKRYLNGSQTAEIGKYEIKAIANGPQKVTIQLIDCNGNALSYSKDVWVGQPIEEPKIKMSMIFVKSPSSKSPTSKGSHWNINFFLEKMPEGANKIDYTINGTNINYSQSGTSTTTSLGQQFFIPFIQGITPCFVVTATAYNSENKACYPNDKLISTSFNTCGKKSSNGGSNQYGNTDDNYFEIYPNPANDVLTVKWDAKENLATNSSGVNIIITDLQGRITHEEKIQKDMSRAYINIADYQNGMYFVKIKYGNFEQTKKVSIQHP